MRNTGRRALDLAGELWLTDGPGGLSAGSVKAEARTLPLGGTAVIRVHLDRRLPDGPWAAKLALGSGWTKRTATGPISFGPVPAAAAARDDRTGQVLTGGLVTSGLVLALFAVYVHRRRTRFRQPVPAAHPAGPPRRGGPAGWVRPAPTRRRPGRRRSRPECRR
ncbi:hypothetical protein E1193_22955 [Micromonospora sp. KC606]|uniref:hypothetical protein n=1 Tax=Micromonospora sp. KC606 TaxID=2530379 RepID=UPI001052132D|nr:hypothetical protein [Micromonospora sp. KC606]TDC77099.1 hypothetical protein E1193_22955 [Micromonospora sp. KC606]